jgi:hypothetical protein
MSQQYKYIDNEYVEFTPPKKKFWQKLLGKAAIFALGLILKNQKNIKGTPNEQKVDEAFEEIDKL